jgi:preprotein translocase subunit SecE
MNRYQKYVNALFLVSAGLVWFVSAHYTEVLVGYFQLARKIGGGAEALQHAVPLLLGVLTFFLLYTNAKAVAFTTDSIGELDKVSWPSKKQVQLGTVVVILTVVIAGAILGVLDFGLTALIRVILGIGN